MKINKDRLIAIIERYFDVGDSDTYICTRDKSAFGLGTMSLDDFQEFSCDNAVDLAEFIIKNLERDR